MRPRPLAAPTSHADQIEQALGNEALSVAGRDGCRGYAEAAINLFTFSRIPELRPKLGPLVLLVSHYVDVHAHSSAQTSILQEKCVAIIFKLR